jgi:hypothetical protein
MKLITVTMTKKGVVKNVLFDGKPGEKAKRSEVAPLKEVKIKLMAPTGGDAGGPCVMMGGVPFCPPR